MKKFSSITKGSSRHTSRNKRLRAVFWVGAILLVLLFLLPRAISFTGALVITPVVMVEDWLLTSQGTVPSYFRDRNSLLNEQRELRRQLAEQDGSNHTINQLQKENQAFRQLLGGGGVERIGAGVVGRPTELPYDTILIDQGSNDGVVVNAPVFIGRNQAIGFVGEVFNNTAVVVLVTTPGIESTVYIYGPNIYTTAEGVGGGLMRVHVPQGIALEEGNLVVMPSFDAGVYGAVVSVESVPTKPEQFGYVSIETPLSGIRFVSVGRAPLSLVTFDEAKEVVDRERNNLLKVPVPEGVLIDALESASSTATTTDQTASSSEVSL